MLPGLRPFMALRIMGGVLLVTSFCMFAFNVIATLVVRAPVTAQVTTAEAVAAMALSPQPALAKRV